jgi:putative hydrolase of the HAD superfamily
MNAPLVLSFDLDDTLWPVGPVIAAAESELLSWLRAH